MRKIYRKDGVLGGEERSTPISIPKWLRESLIKEEKGHEHFSFLLEKGVFFREQFDTYPPEIPKPTGSIEKLACHMNSLVYTLQLFDAMPEKRDLLHFVTGIYSLEAKSSLVPYDRRFFLDHHSFISYKGKVLDPTIITHPPEFFSVKEYYGVSIPCEQIVSLYEELAEEGKDIASITCFLDVVRQKACE